MNIIQQIFGPPKCEGNGWHTIIKRIEYIKLEDLGIRNEEAIKWQMGLSVGVCACEMPHVGLWGDFIDIDFHEGRIYNRLDRMFWEETEE